MMEFSKALDLSMELGRRLGAQRPSERVDLRGAVGRVLAQDVCAEVPVPLCDYSAMDGYAVRTVDLRKEERKGEDPVELPVTGEVFAGDGEAQLETGAALRIFTGAPLPRGADAVIMQEDVERLDDRIRTTHLPRVGENVRRAGEDLRTGDVGLPRGHRVSGFSVGLLSTLERVEVEVSARPRVAILCTGDELRPPGRPGAPGLAESNGVALAALVERVGGLADRLPLASDTLEETERALRLAVRRYDVVLTVGGVSVGDHDYVRPALKAMAAEIVFSKVRMKPGKPVTLMSVGDTVVFGLPGNPASAQVTFALLCAPLLRALQGDRDARPQFRRAELAAPLEQKTGRRNFYRARQEGDRVTALTNQASGAGTAMAWANCLMMISEETSRLEAGATVSVLPYVDI